MNKTEIEKIIKRVQSDADNKNEKRLKEFRKEIGKDFSTQIGVYTEEIKDQYKAINERLDSIDEKLEKHEIKLAPRI